MSSLLKKILEATRLAGAGQPADATAVIQRALSAAGLMPASAPVAPAAAANAGVVLDGLVSEVASPAPSAAPIATPTPAAADAAPRPATSPASFVASSFTAASGTRAFKLFEPAGAFAKPLPLVVMLHGCTQDPDDFAAGTRMNELAQAEGFFVLYPEQAARSNANRCWNWFVPGDQRRGQGEPALLAGMTRHVIATHPVDAGRVYVAGLSAGGAMAAILASEYPDVFAAAGVHSGLPPGAARDVGSAFAAMKSGATAARPPRAATKAAAKASGPLRADPATVTAAPTQGAPVIVFHGSADGTVAPANGDAVIAAALAGRPAVRSDETLSGSGRRARRSVWRNREASAGSAAIAEQWVVDGAPHAWSGGAPAGSFTDPTGPDASRAMLDFFLTQRRTATA